jgi:NAD(P)-dependent dehydrogenase (short-subunit alcohol dehydrogenase family)
VRFLSNRSSGKMGFAIAEAAAKRGAQVKLIAGPVQLATPPGVEREDITSSAQLCEAVERAFDGCDALIMAAAPADFTVAEVAEHKIKKHGEGLTLSLSPTADILARVGARKQKQVVMGFAAETQNLERNAKDKLARKNLDFIAANDVSAANAGFAVDTNAVTLYDAAGGCRQSGLMQKAALADCCSMRGRRMMGDVRLHSGRYRREKHRKRSFPRFFKKREVSQMFAQVIVDIAHSMWTAFFRMPCRRDALAPGQHVLVPFGRGQQTARRLRAGAK